MKRIAALLLLALALAVTGCSSLTEEELAQLNFIAEEALAEVGEDPAPAAPNQASIEPAAEATRPPASSAVPKQIQTSKTNGSKLQAGSQTSGTQTATANASGKISGQTRRSVAAAVASKIPVSSQQGADAAVWQARALIDSLNLDPQDRNTCFRVLNRSFFNRCAEAVAVTVCQSALCYRYQVPAGDDLTIAHDYDSLTPLFLRDTPAAPVAPPTAIPPAAAPQAAAPQAAAPQAAAPVAPKAALPSAQAKPAQAKPAQAKPAQAKPAPTKADQVAKAAPAAATPSTPTVSPEANSIQEATKPAKPRIPRGVPQDIRPEPDGSDLASTEFFSQGGFPLSF